MLHTVFLNVTVFSPLPKYTQYLLTIGLTMYTMYDGVGKLALCQIFTVTLVCRVLLGLKIGVVITDLKVQA